MANTMYFASKEEFRAIFDTKEQQDNCLLEFWDMWFETTEESRDEKSYKYYNYKRKFNMGNYGIEVVMFAKQWMTGERARKIHQKQKQALVFEKNALSTRVDILEDIVKKTRPPEPDYDNIFGDDESTEEEGAGVGLADDKKKQDIPNADKERTKRLYG